MSTANPETDLGRSVGQGPLAWFARNSVAANMLMLVLAVGGLLMLFGGQIRQEVFPEVELDIIGIQVAYPGASPEEVEQGVILAIEEAVRGLEGVKEVRATAMEGTGVVSVELMRGADTDRLLSDVKSAVDRIRSFPKDAERPSVGLATTRSEVLSLVIYGEQSETSLRALAERVRNELLQRQAITQIELGAVRPPEISIEVPRHELREHRLTLPWIARTVREASVDLPAGEVEADGGDVAIRTKERRDRGDEFENIVVRANPYGTGLRLRDIAQVEDGFRDVDREAYFNGQRAVMLHVYRVGDETPLEVSGAVHEYIEQKRSELPSSIDLAVWADRSEMYEGRVELLLRNGYIGLVLVLLVLGLFLELRLAFWVTLGIPISFLGGLLLMPMANASINMVSLFAFIVTLGMVVDDAIVAGEAIYKRRREGLPPVRAAIVGVREVAVPVTFAVVTTCFAFVPLFFVSGVMGKFFRVIPIVVIGVFLVSLVESLLILPAHLAHTRTPPTSGMRGWIHGAQQQVGALLERFVVRSYRPFLARAPVAVVDLCDLCRDLARVDRMGGRWPHRLHLHAQGRG